MSPSAQSRRTSCSPTPSMSAAAMTQLISDSSPRDSHAGFGQRCMTSPSGRTISAPQSGQLDGILNGFLCPAGRKNRPNHLRDHVARALDDHDVALADVLPVDVLLVVERRLRDGDAADLDGLQLSPRVERAGSADADMDLVQLGVGRHRRPPGRACPARPLVRRPIGAAGRPRLPSRPCRRSRSRARRAASPTPRRRGRRPPSTRGARRTGSWKPRSRSHSSVSHWLANSIPRARRGRNAQMQRGLARP